MRLMQRPPSSFALAFLIALLCFGEASVAFGAEEDLTPEEVLELENQRLRERLSEDGLEARLGSYRVLAAELHEVSGLFSEVEPALAELDNLFDGDELGLVLMLAQLDPDLAAVADVIEGVGELRQGIRAARDFERELAVLGADLDKLQAKAELSVEELAAFEAALPRISKALADAAKEAKALEPKLEALERELERFERELGVVLGALLGELGLPSSAFPIGLALRQPLSGLSALKADYDLLVKHGEADAARLAQLGGTLREARAHHAYSSAAAVAQGGDVEAAKESLSLVVETFPGTHWAGMASAWLERGVRGPEAPIRVATEGSIDKARGHGLGTLLLIVSVILLLTVAWATKERWLPSRGESEG